MDSIHDFIKEMEKERMIRIHTNAYGGSSKRTLRQIKWMMWMKKWIEMKVEGKRLLECIKRESILDGESEEYIDFPLIFFVSIILSLIFFFLFILPLSLCCYMLDSFQVSDIIVVFMYNISILALGLTTFNALRLGLFIVYWLRNVFCMPAIGWSNFKTRWREICEEMEEERQHRQ
jgi:hypothetical protein